MKNLELLNKVKEITASGLPFMDGKEKVDLASGTTYVVKDYGYLEGDNGDFVVITDGKETFAYGGSIVSQAFKKLDDQLSHDEIEEILTEGLPVKVTKKKSKNKRDYTTCEFFPKEEVKAR